MHADILYNELMYSMTVNLRFIRLYKVFSVLKRATPGFCNINLACLSPSCSALTCMKNRNRKFKSQQTIVPGSGPLTSECGPFFWEFLGQPLEEVKEKWSVERSLDSFLQFRLSSSLFTQRSALSGHLLIGQRREFVKFSWIEWFFSFWQVVVPFPFQLWFTVYPLALEETLKRIGRCFWTESWFTRTNRSFDEPSPRLFKDVWGHFYDVIPSNVCQSKQKHAVNKSHVFVRLSILSGFPNLLVAPGAKPTGSYRRWKWLIYLFLFKKGSGIS